MKDGCWEWQGLKNWAGYGRFYFAGRTHSAHRAAYILFVGKIDAPEKCVCHSCDNKVCVNPVHLWLGTQMDNMQDKIKKGRAKYARGEEAGKARLTEAQVLEIFSSPDTNAECGRKYKVDPSNISFIRSRKSWAWLTASLERIL